MTHQKQNEILEFWFGSDSLKPLQNMTKWFSKDKNFDQQVKTHFETRLNEAEAGAYDDWVKTKNGALAYVVLCDQFPRNIYRDSEKAFSFDARALKASQIAIDHKLDLSMTTVERCFLYLPFEHSEELMNQERSVELYQSLFKHAKPEEQIFTEQTLDYALRHHKIIKDFGRFPHRNELLNRKSSQTEKEFLKQPGSAF